MDCKFQKEYYCLENLKYYFNIELGMFSTLNLYLSEEIVQLLIL